MNALITGASGFVGTHLAHHLRELNWHIAGFDLRSGAQTDRFFQGELTDRNVFMHALNEVKPDVVFHLAGLIKSPDIRAMYTANLFGTISLFDSIIESNLKPMVIVASSSAVYGIQPGKKSIGEKTMIRPATHYAISKAAQELASLRYFDSGHLTVKVVRTFNLLGSGQSQELACSNFAHQIALAEKHGRHEILTGNLDTYRDFIDVRDAVRALVMTAEKGRDGQIYNVCSGRAVSLQKCLDEMISMSTRELTVRMDVERVQNNDVPIQVGSFQKLERVCGWRPQISLGESLQDLLNDWREKVKSEAE